MLLSSVILVLREVLEAALLVSLLVVLSRRLGLKSIWVLIALVGGLLGAAIYGFNIDRVTDWFDGVGQEVVNALLQTVVYCLLCVLAAITMKRINGGVVSASLISFVMMSCVMLAIVREGSEIMIYLSGFLQVKELLVPVLAGSAIGAGIGVSVGIVFYFGLLNLSRRAAIVVGAALLSLVAAGMLAQATQLLIQADWLPSQYPLWDSSWLVSEYSLTGQLLYALVGYEASPTPLQLAAYCLSLVFVASVALVSGLRAKSAGVAGV